MQFSALEEKVMRYQNIQFKPNRSKEYIENSYPKAAQDTVKNLGSNLYAM
ncbi:hypothetical protein ACVWYG_003759 [Pedobacter sp. UYEF25]